jgi:hypothetical protein
MRGRVSRDSVLFVAGLAGIGWQQYTERISWPLLAVYVAMLGLRVSQAVVRLLPGLPPSEPTGDTSGSPSPSGLPSSSRSSRRR